MSMRMVGTSRSDSTSSGFEGHTLCVMGQRFRKGRNADSSSQIAKGVRTDILENKSDVGPLAPAG